MITAEQMKTLPELFSSIEDPWRKQGQRHRLSTILGIATGTVLCGRVGYKGIAYGLNLWGKVRVFVLGVAIIMNAILFRANMSYVKF